MLNASNVPQGTWTKLPAPIGGGGFLVNWDQSADGLRMVHGMDVSGGGMIRNSTDARWISMMSPATLLSSEYDPQFTPLNNDYFGMPGVRIAPSNKAIIYSIWGSIVWKSTDGGVTQRRTSMGSIHAKPNSGEQRYANPLIDVHPTDPLTVLVGSNHYAADVTKSGAFYSTDGGTTVTKISGLPAATDRGADPDRYLVAFDPGAPANVYVHVGGVGLYASTTGVSGTFTYITASPVRCCHLIVSAAGMVYIAGGANGATNDLYTRTRAGTVASFTTTCPTGALSVAVDTAGARIVCADTNGEICLSYNSGTNWEKLACYNGTISVGTGEIAWLSNRGFALPQLFPAKIAFDTTTANKLWMVHGTGVAYCTVPTATGSTLDWHDFSNGNEEKVGECGLSIPGNSTPILFNWDYFACRMLDLKRWNNRPVGTATGLSIGKDADYAIDDPNFIVAAVAQETASNAVSTDGGKTWGLLPNQTGFGYGMCSVAVGNKNNILLAATYDGVSYYTKNGGTTWNPIRLNAGVNASGLSFAEYLRRRVISSDKTRPGVFALVAPGTPAPDAGLWVTFDGGDTWTKKIAGIIGSSVSGFTGDNRQYWNGNRVAYIPGFSGEMLYTCHDNLGPDWLFHITGDGNSIVRLGGSVGVTDVFTFDFGPVLRGQTRPAVGFIGKVAGVNGVYVSYDWFATTPVLVGRFVLDNLSGLQALMMDRNRLRVFVGSIGWNYVDLVDTAQGT